MLIPGPINVQVLDIEDIGRSAWSQVEAIEMEERGEFRKGSEIIRVTEEDETSDPMPRPGQGAAAGPHKLLLQDAKGTKVFAFEAESVQGIGPGMAIGAKMVLKGCRVARGVLLMTKGTVEVLGGKVETWEKKWREERKAKLKVKAGGNNEGG
jgi:RecQ-mediated genome instability protein 1